MLQHFDDSRGVNQVFVQICKVLKCNAHSNEMRQAVMEGLEKKMQKSIKV